MIAPTVFGPSTATLLPAMAKLATAPKLFGTTPLQLPASVQRLVAFPLVQSELVAVPTMSWMMLPVSLTE